MLGTLKKLCCVFVAALLVLPLLSLASYAKENTDYNGYPVVLVPGYASASLCYDEGGETKAAWGWQISDISSPFADNIVDLIKGADVLFDGDKGCISHALGKSFASLLEPMRCNADGTSVKNVRPVLFDAKETSDEYLNENYPDGDYRVELDMTKKIDSLIGEENVFYFNCDFRMSAVKCAEELDKYITQVKEYTGKDKVNIIAVSHGGLITAAYISLYMQKCDVFNVVMNEPALRGAALAADLMNDEFELDEETLMCYLEYHAQCETDYNWLVKANKLGVLDDIIDIIVPYVTDKVKYWGSIWDFIPTDDYERLKEEYLDFEESKELIAQSDYVHYELMNNYREIFEDAKSLGININIIAGTGNTIVSGSKVNSDGIISTASSTGAKCAPIGKRYENGSALKDAYGESLISPSMEVDASSAYLIYNTWFVDGLFHGMEFWDEYSRSLLFKLLLGDGSMNVSSDKNYPRFHSTTSVTSSVYAAFDKSSDGFLSESDTYLEISNLSQKYKMYVLSVKCDGADIEFERNFKPLQPGEKGLLSFSGSLPQNSAYIKITVTYFLPGSITPLNQRIMYFTANSDSGLQSVSSKFSNSGFETPLEKRASKTVLKIINFTGTKDLADLLYDTASSGWKKLTRIILK